MKQMNSLYLSQVYDQPGYFLEGYLSRIVLCDTFDTMTGIVSTNISITVLKRSRYIVVPRYHQVSWWYQFWYDAVCNWIALLLIATAHCVTAMKKHVTLKLV